MVLAPSRPASDVTSASGSATRKRMVLIMLALGRGTMLLLPGGGRDEWVGGVHEGVGRAGRGACAVRRVCVGPVAASALAQQSKAAGVSSRGPAGQAWQGAARTLPAAVPRHGHSSTRTRRAQGQPVAARAAPGLPVLCLVVEGHDGGRLHAVRRHAAQPHEPAAPVAVHARRLVAGQRDPAAPRTRSTSSSPSSSSSFIFNLHLS